MANDRKPSSSLQDTQELLKGEGYKLLAIDLTSAIPPQGEDDRRPQPDSLRLRPGTSPPTAPTIEHQPPTAPLSIDGVERAADSLSEFNGQPLFYAVEEKGDVGTRLHAYTTEAAANDFIISRAEIRARPDRDRHAFFGSHVWPTYTAYFYEHAGCQGGRMQLDYRHAAWDLREWWLGGILWWWTSWNDQISSLITSGRGVKLYEHINWGGSWIYFGPSRLVWNLTDFGWNDRTSSIETTF